MKRFLQEIFSVRNNKNKSHKIIKIFGFKVKLKNVKFLNYDIIGTNNFIYLTHQGINKEIIRENIKNLDIQIYGNNNTIILDSTLNIIDSKIYIAANNSNITIQKTKLKSPLIFYIEIKSGDNQSVNIGEDFSCAERLEIWCHEKNSCLKIGNNVMCSKNVSIMTSDSHSIFIQGDDTPYNFRKSNEMIIGDNVWLGKNSMVLKNASIPVGTVLSGGGVLSKPVEEPNCIVAGNPAVVIKKNIKWQRTPISNYK